MASKISFHRGMNTAELLLWLKQEGLGDKAMQTISDEEMTGESFLLLTEKLLSDIGVRTVSRLLLLKLHEAVTTGASPTATPSPLPETARSLAKAEPPVLSRQEEMTESGRNNLSDVPSNDQPSQNVIVNQLRGRSLGKCHSIADDGHRSGAGAKRLEFRQRSSSSTAASLQSSLDDVPGYCSDAPFFPPTPGLHHRVWEDREVLQVHFKRSPLLDDWSVTESDILSWASAWQNSDSEIIPTFVKAKLRERADIRIHFSDSKPSWSMVGRDAEKITDVHKPTMLLNLHGLSRSRQKSLVIHEFGHALGLEHEHQRSDFIATVGKFLNQSKIPEGEFGKVMVDSGTPACEYDCDSIMHYWFNPEWLQDSSLADSEAVALDNRLTAKQKRHLVGMLSRQGEELLPAQPSSSDLDYLNEAYENPGVYSQPTSIVMPTPYCEDPPESPVRRQPVSEPVNQSNSQPQPAVLSDSHLRLLREILWDARAKWRDIGRGLRFSEGHLNACQRGSVGESLVAVLRSWVHDGQATIPVLARALKQPTVGRGDLARILNSVDEQL